MTVRLVQVIYSDEARNGKGIEGDLMRSLPSLYTLDGELICQFDCGPDGDAPMAHQFVVESALAKLRQSGGTT